MKYIFEITIKEGCTVDEYVNTWKEGSALIQKFPGARGTRLYRKTDDPNKLLAIAEWDSVESRDYAMKELEQADLETQKISKKHNNFGELKKLGAFEETNWQVLPHK